ncbi:MAG: Holliday junction branch migration protein RuvA [Burkholderiales bacterium]
MIGRIQGALIAKRPPQIVLDVHGIGYEIDVPMSTFYTLPNTGEQVALLTHLVVREDAHLLFGFATEDERAAFRQLLKISGIGARTALAVLSGMSVNDLRQSIVAQEARILTSIPGIGKKTADRLLLELRDKLPATQETAQSAHDDDVENALIALGYNAREAAWATQQLPPNSATADGIRQALKLLSKS